MRIGPSLRGRLLALATTALGVIAAGGLGMYLLRGTGGSSDACIAEAIAHVPEAESEGLTSYLWGAHLDRARAGGFDDSGSLDDVDESRLETGAIPDNLTFMALDPATGHRAPSEIAGYDTSQMTCWAGTVDLTRNFAAVGAFDEDQVAGSELGADSEVATTGDLLTYDEDGDAEALLEPQRDLEGDLSILVEALDDHEAAGFYLLDLDGSDEPAPPVAVAHAHDGGWDLLLLWLFPDDNTAEAGLDAVTAMLDDDRGRVPVTVEADPVDHLELDGRVVTLRAPLSRERSWMDPAATLSPVLDPLNR